MGYQKFFWFFFLGVLLLHASIQTEKMMRSNTSSTFLWWSWLYKNLNDYLQTDCQAILLCFKSQVGRLYQTSDPHPAHTRPRLGASSGSCGSLLDDVCPSYGLLQSGKQEQITKGPQVQTNLSAVNRTWATTILFSAIKSTLSSVKMPIHPSLSVW